MQDKELMGGHLGPERRPAIIPELDNLRQLPKEYHKHFNIDDDYTWDDLLTLEMRLNNYGFRSDEDYHLENEPNEVWCFGCSHTMGTGLPLHHTWPHILEKQLEVKTKNFGIGGSGADLSWRLIKNWVENSTHKPEHVYILGFHHPRFSIYDGRQWLNINEPTKEFITRDADKSLLKIIDKKWNEILYEDTPIEENMIKEFLDKHKIKYSIVNPKVLFHIRKKRYLEDSKLVFDFGNDIKSIDNFHHSVLHGYTPDRSPGCHPGLGFQKEAVEHLLKT